MQLLDEIFTSDPQATSANVCGMMPRRPRPTIVKLSDNFGQYVLLLSCKCGHSRHARPQTFARIFGWDATLAEVLKKLRCSKCGKRQCNASVRHETKRDG